MINLPDMADLLGVKPIFLKAGTAGAIVGAVVQRAPDWREAIARGITGFLCAAYFTPVPVHLLGADDDATKGAMAFCVGLGGMGLATAIMMLLKDPLKSYQRWKSGGSGGTP